MKRISYILICFCLLTQWAQAQLVLNGGGKIKINGGTAANPVFLVLNNAPAIPISTSGTSDGIIMEAEYNRLQYNLGTGNTAITVPYLSLALEQIPLNLVPTVAGTGTGNIRFSSMVAPVRATGFNNASYMPSDVTNMGAMGVPNNSDNTIDRFWIIDANGYTTRPAVTLSFTYPDPEWVANGGNTITESMLRAQRFNSSIGNWGGVVDYVPTGTINTSTNTVSNVVVTPAAFFRSWTLNDMSLVLPVELLSFTAVLNAQETVDLDWRTASEAGNDHFDVQRSTNAQDWETIQQVAGAGTTSSPTDYHTVDEKPYPGISYYRLVQVDVDGASTYSNIHIIHLNQQAAISVMPNPFTSQVTVYFEKNENVQAIQVYDACGRFIRNISPAGTESNIMELQLGDLSNGIYYLGTADHLLNEKIIKTN